MTLAQEKPFKRGDPFKAKLAYDMPTRDSAKARDAIITLRRNYMKMSPVEKQKTIQLLQEAWRTLVELAKNKRDFTSAERKKFWEIALLYSALKSEFSRSVKG
jgi:hypothetical protein